MTTPLPLDPDDLDRTVQALMSKHESDACRITQQMPDGSVLLLLTEGQVYKYEPGGEATRTGHHIMQPVVDVGGVQYVPFVHRGFGIVGHLVVDETESAERPVTFIYFNPSDHTDEDDEPNAFVYQGPFGDPTYDEPMHHYTVWREHP